MKNTKDTMKAFVDYAQPVILEIKKRHNQFIKLDNYALALKIYLPKMDV